MRKYPYSSEKYFGVVLGRYQYLVNTLSLIESSGLAKNVERDKKRVEGLKELKEIFSKGGVALLDECQSLLLKETIVWDSYRKMG